MDEALVRAVDLLGHRRFAVLTGAGVSTDSGIPDYRGPGAPTRNPMTYQQFVGDPAYRRTYWARNHVGFRHVSATAPNDGHRALAAMESAGLLTGLVTQNVDRLHLRAGSREVVELHGSYAGVVCLACGERTARADLAHRLDALNPGWQATADVEVAPDADAVIASTEGFVVADCARCGGLLKPDIVYFGETVPPERVARAYAMVEAAQALLVAGSSLTVASGYRFVRRASDTGRPVVIVNRGATRGDRQASLTIDAGTSETLSALAAALPAHPAA